MEHRARRRDSRAAVELAARAAEDFAGEVILVRLQDQARKPFEVLTLEARPLLILEKSAKAATANRPQEAQSRKARVLRWWNLGGGQAAGEMRLD
jgi:hypothetical protein